MLAHGLLRSLQPVFNRVCDQVKVICKIIYPNNKIHVGKSLNLGDPG